MSLEQQLSADIAAAMKAKDTTKLTALRMLKTALTNKSIEKGRALEAAEELQVVSMLVKQRRDSIEQFTKGSRPDLADKEQAEIVVLEPYLPARRLDDEIAAAVAAAVTETGATGPKDMGKVMKAVMAALAGKTVDGKKVSEAVKATAEPLTEPRSGSETFCRIGPSIPLKGLVSLSPSSSGSCRTAGAHFFARLRLRGWDGAPKRAPTARMLRFRCPMPDSAPRLARSAGVFGLATITSRILGLVREQVLAYYFGAGDANDAFRVASRIPNLVRDLFAEGAMSAAFVPTFTGYLTRGGRERSWRARQLRHQRAAVVTGVIVVLGIIFAEPLVRLFAGEFAEVPGKLELTIFLTRIVLPFLTLVAIAAVLMGMLNSLGHFFVPGAVAGDVQRREHRDGADADSVRAAARRAADHHRRDRARWSAASGSSRSSGRRCAREGFRYRPTST